MTPYWQSSDGRLVIYHGDARGVLPTLDPLSIDLVLTDPPYGIGMKAFRDDFEVVRALNQAPGGIAAVFMSPRRIGDLIESVRPSWSFGRLLWMHKTADIAAPWRGWCMNSEAIAVFSRPTADWPAPTDYRSDVYSVGPWERAGHPNGKPVAVVKDLLRRLSNGQTTLDPFMGSGTTLAAAQHLDRRAIGIEIEERYCEIAARRLEDPPLIAMMRDEQPDLFAEVS